ncbi:MAG: hypothetical protein M1608_17200 [Candidatus Omnitrophica bacterium]|nr:hypothetical protein [Candidatus Omnitrophota bacterium]
MLFRSGGALPFDVAAAEGKWQVNGFAKRYHRLIKSIPKRLRPTRYPISGTLVIAGKCALPGTGNALVAISAGSHHSLAIIGEGLLVILFIDLFEVY